LPAYLELQTVAPFTQAAAVAARQINLFIAPFKSHLIGFSCIATNGASVKAGLHDHPDHLDHQKMRTKSNEQL